MAHRPSRWLGLLTLAGILACAPVRQTASAAQPITVIVPRGAYAAVLAGSDVTPLPTELRVTVGQVVRVRNEDQAVHYFAGEPVLPGEEISKVFGQTGTFFYVDGMSCSLLEHSSMAVIVEAPGQSGTVPSLTTHGH